MLSRVLAVGVHTETLDLLALELMDRAPIRSAFRLTLLSKRLSVGGPKKKGSSDTGVSRGTSNVDTQSRNRQLTLDLSTVGLPGLSCVMPPSRLIEALRIGVGIADPDTERGAPADTLPRGLIASDESDTLRVRGRPATDGERALGEREVFALEVGNGGC